MTGDARTLAAYEAHVGDYADRFASAEPGVHLKAFIAALPPAAHVLDLGCGPGTASAFLRAAGHRPDPVDATPAMVALANARHALGARLGSFDDIEAEAAYDGVWANFSLLHAPRERFPLHLAALHRALKPRGLFHIGMKLGAGEARDALDRFYCYYSREELLALLAAAGFSPQKIWEGRERGLAGTEDPFIVVQSHA
ncbi:class I SAM-dependent methyltransferase [Frigidibacter sp. RF13]|uniref:class I SAM-dependent DNA methyltransferase n=1 Tax=Frigidibacter sp. RF13 TaxID=2997340 RepID=UPI002270DAF9|nr:class I SAM-dependent methyltransferase [Frigidibacter sp. RF13]MCY1127596.1 class I SAM-dependent methyltransferase [Frigidibacter sp. RF13]